MNFRSIPDAYEKLDMLQDSTRFEPAGGQPLQEGIQSNMAQNGLTGQKPLPCVSTVSTPTGKKPILKSMMTTACERNCFYCPFRAGRSKMKRITFTPDEMASTFNQMERQGHVDGLFLSSGIIKGGVTTQDKIIDAAELVRKKYGYRGYVHLKIMPGAERDQLHRAMQLADRVSINLEGPTEQRLSRLAPNKNFWQELFQRIQWVSQLRRQEHLRASVVTQFVVGAVEDTDLELLALSDRLYNQLGLKRTYFSAFHPVTQTPFEGIAPTPKIRERRLYQSSFLLRDYGWNVEDLPFQQNTNLRLDVDPKQAWADEYLRQSPVEINRAQRSELLRIPGIGPKHADAILAARRRGLLLELAHLRKVGVKAVEKSAPYILLNGRTPAKQLALFS